MTKINDYLKQNWFKYALLFIGLHIVFFQNCGYDLSKINGDLGDSRFIMSIVEYNYQWLIGHYSSYWDGFFMYPEREVISYSDNLLGITPFYSIFRVLGIDTHTSFQLLILLSHILNYLFCYFCFKEISKNKIGAATGAFIFAFSIALNGLNNHPQFTFRFCIPLFFYFLYNYLNTANFKNLFYAAIAIVLQFYLSIYLGYFLLLGGILFTAVILSFNVDRKKFLLIIRHVLLITPLALLSLFYIFYFYYKRIQTTGYYTDYEFYMETLPRISSYFKAFPNSLFWSFLSKTNVDSKYEWFHFLFPGALVLISILASIYLFFKHFNKRDLNQVIIMVIVIIMIHTIYYDGHTLYGYVMKIPGIKSARIVTRLITVLIFFFAWLVCLNINFVITKIGKQKKILIFILPFLLIADNYCFPEAFKAFSKKESKARVELIEKKVVKLWTNDRYEAFAFLHGIKKDGYILNIDAMLCALKLKIKTVNGYSSSCDYKYGEFWRNADSVSLSKWCNMMGQKPQTILQIK